MSGLTRMLIALACLIGGSAFAAETSDPRQTWQLLDYLAVDYRGAVSDGHIVSESEYAEMREFAATVHKQLQGLPEKPGRDVLLTDASALATAIERRHAADEVAAIARKLADELLASYPIPVAPKAAPDLARGQQLFEAQCSACHGARGAADGPAARTLNPPPIAFTDRERARQRSPFSYYSVITQGVEGTSMASFKALPDADRWALAFYASTLSYSSADRAAGAADFHEHTELRALVPDLETLARTSEEFLQTRLSADRARELIAFLRSTPAEAVGGIGARLAMARSRLGESVRAHEQGNFAEAQRLALSAYLDGIEPVEPMLSTTAPALLARLETAMAGFRASVGDRSSGARVSEQAREIEGLFQLAEQVLAQSSATPMTAFLGSLTILLREGLEALLIVVAIIAFLRKANRPELLPYVHGGWIAALLAGAVTWALATYVVNITGANREVTEGVSSLFAAAVLLSVGLWMHGKSLAGRWQQYLTEKITHALSKRSVWFLAGLAFVAVYREVFETILFYAALWTQGQHAAVLMGLGVAVLGLAAITYAMLRASMRLPIAKFFSVSAVLVGILSVVLVGKGVAALQEAGLIALRPLQGPRVDLLGIYPNLESVLAQLAVAAAVVVGFVFNHRSTRTARH